MPFMADLNPPTPGTRRAWQMLGAHAQSILEWALDAVVTIDHHGKVLAWNPQAEKIFGWTREEVVGRPLHELIIPPSDRQAHLAGLRRFLLTGEGPILSRRFETSGRRKDGGAVLVELTIIPESTSRGWIFTAFLRDVSELRRVDAALRESEQSFRDAFVHAGTGMVLTSVEGRFVQVNRVFAEMLGYSEEELVGRAFNDVTHPEDRKVGLDALRRLLAGEAKSEQIEKRYVHRDGRAIWVLISPTLIRDAAGIPVHFITQVQDLTRRRNAEEALRASEERFRTAFHAASIGMTLADLGGRFIQVNRAFCRMAGRGEAELLKMKISEVTHPEDREESGLLLKRVLDGSRESGDIVKRYLRPDGSVVWGEVRVAIVRNASGEPIHTIAQILDITRRKQAEEALHASEKTYRLLFEDSPNPMWVYDAATLQFLAVNEAAVALYGYTRAEFRAMTIKDIRPVTELPRLLASQKMTGPHYQHHGEWIHRRKNGTELSVEVSTHGIRFEGRDAVLALLQDLTEKKRQEGHLTQAAKMEAVGRLAGGVAHDLNNLLTIIQGYGQLLSKKLARGEAAAGELDEIRYAAQRGNSLTQQLLAFSRRQVLRPKVLDLNVQVANMDQLLRRVIGENIELVAALDPRIGRVKADPGQLDQVILNLALNARDAMPSGGRLTVSTGTDVGGVAAGSWVTLEVSDTGSGMDASTLSHIFEPFFTTKEGRGTGLGLATVYGIVQQSGGLVRVVSKPGQGSTFRVFLPRATEEMASVDSAPLAAARRGTETILVVEDEPRVRALAVRVLREIGYTVLEAEDPAHAIRLAETDKREIHLLFTDVLLPGLSGPEIARRFTTARPRSRVLFTSGHFDSAVPGSRLPEGASFLPKPFTDDVLARRVREVLDAPALGGDGS
ncbi:MAG: PAS/PAC sensor hybrid histidine [Planctomycetota bacterium]|nr:MAG: PAS/PAC sensor hybrid histidine [Planctomycetota bacterium]